MRTILFVALVATMMAPVAYAAPNAHTGTQTGSFWSEYSEHFAVQAGTGYELHGVAGDHDIVFYNADGIRIGSSSRCGSDAGTVPTNAVTAQVRVWDHDGELFPCATSPLDSLPASQWVYVDGL